MSVATNELLDVSNEKTVMDESPSSPSTTPNPAPISSADFELNPELYGLRRSRRSHAIPERYSAEQESTRSNTYAESSASSDDDDGSNSRRRSRKKKKNQGRRKRSDEYEDDDGFIDGMNDNEEEDEDDDDDHEEVFATSKRARAFEKAQAKKRRKLHNKKKGEDEEDHGGFAAQMRFSTRNNKVVNYSIDEDDEDFEDYVSYKEHELPPEAFQEDTGPGEMGLKLVLLSLLHKLTFVFFSHSNR